MTDYVISCEAFVRLAAVAAPDGDFQSLRLDNGIAVVSDGKILVCERVMANSPGVVQIVLDPLLVQQCRQEIVYNSTLTITVVEMLAYATAKTTFGYVHPSNVLYTAEVGKLGRWREVVALAALPAAKPDGAMFWDMSSLTKLAAASPSGGVVFEDIIDINRPAIIADANDPDWCAFFYPFAKDVEYNGATFPSWLK